MTIWQHLQALRAEAGATISDLLADASLTAQKRIALDELVFDFGKTAITEAAWTGLVRLAGPVVQARANLFGGVAINETEGRAVLHTALRASDDAVITVDGDDVMPQVRATRARMADFATAVRSGAYAPSGQPITDVINIGIGGSDLGPAMAALALAPYRDGPRVHFVSNVDGADFAETTRDLDPARTLVIVASKTFTTIETMTNAETAKVWMAENAHSAAHFVAVSTAAEKVGAFGIPPERMFGFADWVGGRYSLWGPVGLALMLAIGPAGFDALLAGGRAMDQHFQTAPLDQNMPVALALVGVWHHQVCGYPTRAVLPYDNRLSRLPAYLQQLEMESNGKGVTMAGAATGAAVGPVVWGEPGTNGQHAFYQLIHQGVMPVPCEFMVAARGHEPTLDHHHRLLLANCMAQSEALMRGRSHAEARAKIAGAFAGEALERQAAHRVFTGNRPSSTLIYPQLTPYVLGQIIALYEHRVFVEGVILGINSFDQWGVELGKELATALGPMIDGADASAKDSSTQFLLRQLLTWRASDQIS